MKKLLIIIALVVFLLSGCFNKEESDAVKFKNEYEELNGKTNSAGTNVYTTLSISKTNTVKYKTEKQIVEILKDGTGIIYFGFPSCPWCRNATSVLLEVAEEENVAVNYLNVLDIRSKFTVDNEGKLTLEKEGTKDYYKILELLDSNLEDYILTTESGEKINTGEKRLFSPTAVFVKDGEVVGIHVSTVESHEDPYVELTSNQKKELKNIYLDFINKINE